MKIVSYTYQVSSGKMGINAKDAAIIVRKSGKIIRELAINVATPHLQLQTHYFTR